jgi:uncharacterized damage-inducible protein DinB
VHTVTVAEFGPPGATGFYDEAMTWTAPEVAREPMPRAGDERAMLDGLLDLHRLTLLHKCAGLTAGQLAARSAEPSGLSLLGLLRHMTDVERGWFRRGFARQVAAPLYSAGENPDGDFDDADAAAAEQDLAAYQREVELVRAAVAGHALDETLPPRSGRADISLRWIYLHLIGEYARHNGHADLLRERIDGATGM